MRSAVAERRPRRSSSESRPRLPPSRWIEGGVGISSLPCALDPRWGLRRRRKDVAVVASGILETSAYTRQDGPSDALDRRRSRGTRGRARGGDFWRGWSSATTNASRRISATASGRRASITYLDRTNWAEDVVRGRGLSTCHARQARNEPLAATVRKEGAPLPTRRKDTRPTRQEWRGVHRATSAGRTNH
jgi:hypothetical protein